MTSPLSPPSSPNQRAYEVALAAARSPGQAPTPQPPARPHSLGRVALAVLFVAGLLGFLFPEPGQARLVLDFGTYQRFFEGEVISGMTVLDALNASAWAGQIPLEFSIEEGQAVILELDGHRDTVPVAVMLNGQPVDPAEIHAIPVRARDEITIRLADQP